MAYPDAAWERAMTVREVMLKALSGELHWFQAVNVVGRPMQGSPGAKMVMVEYSDFECPFCGAFARDVLPTIVHDYVDSGKVQLVFKNLPLPMHKFALSAGIASVCADQQGKFWAMHEHLFSPQGKLADDDLRNAAASIGLGLPAYEDCRGGKAAAALIEADSNEAKAFGITGTPTFVFGSANPDGHVKATDILSGAKPAAAFRAILDKRLAPATR